MKYSKFFVGSLAAMMLLTGCDKNAGSYEKAQKLFAAGRYSEAATAFTQLQEYKDSTKYIDYCSAIALAEAGDFQGAVDTLSYLSDTYFYDSRSRSRYYQARVLEASGDDAALSEALQLYINCVPLEDSLERSNALKSRGVTYNASASNEVEAAEVPAVETTETPDTEASVEITEAPTAEPTAVPTLVPTVVPTVAPTEAPTAEPTAVPTEVPTAEPTAVPTAEPTAVPTAEPTAVPTEEPTAVPTEVPTAEPTAVPTETPTTAPTVEPTEESSSENDVYDLEGDPEDNDMYNAVDLPTSADDSESTDSESALEEPPSLMIEEPDAGEDATVYQLEAVVRVVKTYLNVRSQPDKESEIVYKLTSGDRLTVTSDPEQEWVSVRLEDGTEGYVMASFLNINR